MEIEEKNGSVGEHTELLHDAVFSVGTFKPKFNPGNGKMFSDELNILGTAFLTSKSSVLITCAHVVDSLLKLPLVELAGLLVVGYKGQFYRAIIQILDYQHDLAVLKIVDPFDVAIKGLDISSEGPKQSERVCWAGYPLGNYLLNQLHDPTYNEGVVGIAKREENNLGRKYIQISGVVIGGYSGSPVINKLSGEIIGVVSNGPENTGIFMAISFEHVCGLINLAES